MGRERRRKGGEGEGKWKIPQEDEPAGKHRVSYFPGLHDCFSLFSSIFLQALARLFLHHVYWHVKLLAGGVQKEDRGILAFLRGVGRDLDLLLGSAAWNTFLANHYWHLRKLFLFVWGACVLRLVAFVE